MCCEHHIAWRGDGCSVSWVPDGARPPPLQVQLKGRLLDPAAHVLTPLLKRQAIQLRMKPPVHKTKIPERPGDPSVVASAK